MPDATWKRFGKDVAVLSLWDTIGPKWPQIVILRLSKDEYKKFLKDSKAYLNSLGVFGDKPTRKVVRIRLARIDEKVSGSLPAEFLVVGDHDFDCTTWITSSDIVKF